MVAVEKNIQMIDTPTISKNPPKEPGLNWLELRKMAILQLENLGSDVWTDFNLHDPGITIIEVLCYALTDLSYRTHFPMEDLLHRGEGAKKDFFTPREILNSMPVTPDDYRKLIIDCFVDLTDEMKSDNPDLDLCFEQTSQQDRRVIKNAWVSKGCVDDPPIYQHNEYEFSRDVVDKIADFAANMLIRNEIHEKAIFQELVENLDDFMQCIEAEIENGDDNDGLKKRLKRVLYLLLDDIEFTNILRLNLIPRESSGSTDTVQYMFNLDEIKELINLYVDSIFGGNLSEKELWRIEKEIFKGSYLSYDAPKTDPISKREDSFGDVTLDISFNDENLVKEGVEPEFCPLDIQGLNRIQLELVEDVNPLDIDAVDKIKEKVREKLNAHRALGEDFLEIEIVKVQNIGICAEVEVDESREMEEIEAQIYFDVQAFLTPIVNFYSYEELKAKKKSCESIFNGPFLDHGFLLTEELGSPELPSVVNKSDLLQVMMDIPGIIAVRTLKLYTCKGGEMQEDNVQNWQLNIPPNHKAQLDLDCCEVKFKIGNQFRLSKQSTVKSRLALIKKLADKPAPGSIEQLPLSTGSFRNIDQYFTIQNLFPETYYIGRTGTPSTATNMRKAQAKQLRAFLLFFDQLLANYLAQLGQVKNLLSVSQDLSLGTYFDKVLSPAEVPGVDELYYRLEKVEFFASEGLDPEFKEKLAHYIKEEIGIENIVVGKGNQLGILTDDEDKFWFNEDFNQSIKNHYLNLIEDNEDLVIRSIRFGAAFQYIFFGREKGVYFPSDAFPRNILDAMYEIEESGQHVVDVHWRSEDTYLIITDAEHSNWRQKNLPQEVREKLNELAENESAVEHIAIDKNNNYLLISNDDGKYWYSGQINLSLETALKDYFERDKKIVQLAFDEQDGFIVLAARESKAPEIEDKFSKNVRKNEILDHLLARFGEQFSDYAIAVFNASTSEEEQTQTKKIEAILDEKIRLLESIPKISGERGRGYNYQGRIDGLPDVWDSSNVAGIKHRICRYLGWKSSDRTTLSCMPTYKVKITGQPSTGRVRYYSIKMVGTSPNEDLLIGIDRYANKNDAQKAGKDIFTQALNFRRYSYKVGDREYKDIEQINIADNREEIKLLLRNHDGVLIAESGYLNKTGVQKRYHRIKELAFPDGGLDPGFHILEHVLLRPDGHTSYELLQPFKVNCNCTANDPYSFWITVMAPGAQEVFEKSQRYFFEQIVRRELPSHIGVRFLYLDNEQMYEFEASYQSWLTEKAKERPNDRILVNHQNNLVRFLNNLKDDCENPDELGRTDLSCLQALREPKQSLG